MILYWHNFLETNMVVLMLKKLIYSVFFCCLCSGIGYAENNKKIILFVWDGLRPDSITQQTTPNLYQLSQEGAYFSDNHSSYPTFTMMNAASFATGDFAGKTGFYGNSLWNNRAKGDNSSGNPVDFQQPVFTEDYKILADLNREEPLTEVYTLFRQAHEKNISTATVGKSGPAYFQDYYNQGIIFDEKHVFPQSFAEYLKSIHYPLPANTVESYSGFTLDKNNGNPTAFGPVMTLKDRVTADPVAGVDSPYNKNNTYLMQSYLTQIVPKYHPTLSVVWLRNPDTTEHNYGVGSTAYYSALLNQDQLLGKLITQLKSTGQWNNTDLIIVSDHAHSNVSGDLTEFPLRNIKEGKVTTIDNIHGYAVSGDMRPADLLSRAGFKAYDGLGCQYDPVLSGIKADGSVVYPTLYDKDGKICGKQVKDIDVVGHREEFLSSKYNTPSYIVPKALPKDAIIVANNGGSTYFYVPGHGKKLIEKLVRFCQSRQEFGAMFVDERYGNIPGTLSLKLVKLQNDQQRNPDLIVASNYNAEARIQGFAGTEFNSGMNRGMHGSFSPVDVHNTLIAYGPDFKQHFVDSLPSGNVDVAPTIAYLLGLTLPNTDGRVLSEALITGPDMSSYSIKINDYAPQTPAEGLVLQLATSPDGKDIDRTKSHYTILLQTKNLQQNGKTYTYFDWAKALRY